jgi:hypothetical protein
MTMAEEVRAIIHFMDGTKVAFEYPKQAGEDPTTIASNVKKALDSDKIVLEAQGDLIIIPIRNIKYIQVSPAPDKLPKGILRKARFVS